MPYYNCQLCSHICINKRAFDSHMRNKTHIKNVQLSKNIVPEVSPEPREFKCESCDKVYNHYSSLARHKRTCIQDTINTRAEAVPADVQEAIINKWRAEHGLLNLVPEPAQQPAPTQVNQTINNQMAPVTNNTTNTTAPVINNTIAPVINQTITNHITNIITPFGKEDISHISFEKRRDIIDRNREAYRHLTEEIYKNDRNHNIVCTDKRNGIFKYMKEDGSMQTDKLPNMLKEIIRTNTRFLKQFYDECESTFSDRRLDILFDLINDSFYGVYDDKYEEISKEKLASVAMTSKAHDNYSSLADK